MALAEKTESQQQKLARRKEEATPVHMRAPKGSAVFNQPQVQTKEEAQPESKPLSRSADPWHASMAQLSNGGSHHPMLKEIGQGKPVQLKRVGAPAWPIQAKLKVGEPNDRFEQEADQVAEKVVQQKSMSAAPPAPPSAPPAEGGGEEIKTKKVARKGIQRKPAGVDTSAAPTSVEQGLESRKGKGSPLSPETQSQMEGAIGADFSGVRVHTDSEAVQMSQDLNAQAFTHGGDIYFNQGKYNPGTDEGDRLLAHELTHTVQQGAAPESKVDGGSGGGNGNAGGEGGKAQRKPKSDAPAAQKKVQRKAKRGADAPAAQKKVQRKPTSGVPDINLLQEAVHGVPTIQRSIISDIVSLASNVGVDIARIADNIPGYTLFCYIIEYDILRDTTVSRDMTNLIRGLMGLIPFGNLAFEKLQEYQIISKAVTWVEAKLSSLNLTTARLIAAGEAAWNEMGITKGIDGNLAVIRNHFSPILNDVKTFATDAAAEFLKLVKEALLKPLVAHLEANSPAYQLATKVLHRKFPLEDRVEASTEVILEDFLKLIGKTTEAQQMKEKGVLKKAADWIDTQLNRFFSLLGRFKSIVETIWNAFSLETLGDILKVFRQVWTDFTTLLKDFLDFALEVALKILELVKTALLSALASHANSVPGFHLITVILRKNPFTEEAVPRTTENIIRGFMSLAPGGEAKFQELKESGVVPRAAGKIDALVDRLGISWSMIVDTFTGVWKSLSINDLVHPIAAFRRIVDQFGAPIAKIFTFIWEVVKILVELVLGMMGLPGNILGVIVSNVMAAFEKIKKDPVKFFINLLRAVKSGFEKFFGNFLTHLMNGLQTWLFGQLGEAGITPPPDITFKSILGLSMQVLGITVDNILARLALKIGQDKVDKIKRVLNALTGIWKFVSDVIERGPIAIWEYVQEKLNNLWDIVVNGIKEFIMTRIISAVVSKLLSFLDPTGIMPVINSFIAFFRAVQTFVEKLAEILQIIASFTQGILEIANGSIGSAAAFLERALAGGLPIAIAFLANQVGLGKIGDKIKEMIEIAREKINEGIDWLIDKALAGGKAILDAIMGRGGQQGRGPDSPVTDAERRQHEAWIAEIKRDLETQSQGARDQSYQAFHQRLMTRAEYLRQQYQPRLRQGINLTITIPTEEQDQSDQDVDIEIKIAPNTSLDRTQIRFAGGSTSLDPYISQLRVKLQQNVSRINASKASSTISTDEVATELKREFEALATNLSQYKFRITKQQYSIVLALAPAAQGVETVQLGEVGLEYIPAGNGPAQQIFRKVGSNSEFVRDANNQWVPRYCHRFLSPGDLPTIQAAMGISPEDPTGGSNVNEAQHIGGKGYYPGGKSPFLSITTSQEHILNRPSPGASPVNFNYNGRIRIDMSHLASAVIRLVSTPQGIDLYLRPNFPGLSGAQQSVVMGDAVRTKEVLVRSPIPQAAIVAIEDKAAADAAIQDWIDRGRPNP